jgi:hypothetical protein
LKWVKCSLMILILVSRIKKRQRLRVYGNRVLRRIFGTTKKEVAVGWRRLDNEELHSLYALQNGAWERREMHRSVLTSSRKT